MQLVIMDPFSSEILSAGSPSLVIFALFPSLVRIQGIHARGERNLTLLDVYARITTEKSGNNIFPERCIGFKVSSADGAFAKCGCSAPT